MFRIQTARTSQDFSVGAYRRFGADDANTSFSNVTRALGRIVGRFMRRFLQALYETRRGQAFAVLNRYGDLIEVESQCHEPVVEKQDSDSAGVSFAIIGPAAHGMRIRCSITGAPCEGDRAFLCDEWGCARKGGLSPISHENF